MPATAYRDAAATVKEHHEKTLCYHCGTACITNNIQIEDKTFCCDGCKLVYELLNENNLCDYYKIQSHPGLSQIKAIRNDKYAYLDNDAIAKSLCQFTNGDLTIVNFYLPSVHCSSCMWLLEHLPKVNPGILESRLNFTSKEVTIRFLKSKISLRGAVELLCTIGYEPYISLDDTGKKAANSFNKQRIYKLGVAGFCFGNIMMMSFPEYLSMHSGIERQYANLFRYLNLLLSIPVFFYSATEFFSTAWKGLQQKTLNIDAPIALAIIITFARSIYEIFTNTSGGYLDSMSGIVFFMLVGRVVQERTYKSISFSRDYKSYFPIAVNVVTANGVASRMLNELREEDVVQLHSDEIIPADGIVLEGTPCIDYSFVTGESEPVKGKVNDMVYAGGKQVGGQLTVRIIKPVAGSYLTSLWNHYAFSRNKAEDNDARSAIHLLSKYFTWILFGLAILTAVYWGFTDQSKIIGSVTAMLIVACPCALLLTATFTNGNLLRIFSNNGLYLRDTTVIEPLSKADHLVFDKTGTITRGGGNAAIVSGHQVTEQEKALLYSTVKPSKHPYSKAIASWVGLQQECKPDSWTEVAGSGVEARFGQDLVRVGSAEFVGLHKDGPESERSTVYVLINSKITSFRFSAEYRDAIPEVIGELKKDYSVSLLSGDNDKQRASLSALFGSESSLLFEQKPIDKLHYIEAQQQKGHKVVMIGDGLNDAGALQQSDVGITLADDINNFTPSCDAILDAGKFEKLPAILKLAKASKLIIASSFAVSVLYNLAGLYYAMQGVLRPMVAAILMPCSTVTIVLLTSGASSLIAVYYKLNLKIK